MLFFQFQKKIFKEQCIRQMRVITHISVTSVHFRYQQFVRNLQHPHTFEKEIEFVRYTYCCVRNSPIKQIHLTEL